MGCSWTSYCIDRLYRLQKQVARIVLGADMDTSSHSMFKTLKWLTVKQRIVYQRCLEMYLVFKGSSPEILCNMFPPQQEKCYDLRSNELCSLNMCLSRAKSNLYERSFLHSGAQLWNTLPGFMKSAETKQHFKQMCKMYILNN